jgi:hypothetical protein
MTKVISHAVPAAVPWSVAGLVVVLCPERSGSTLLATMLGANPRVLAPPELFLLRYRDYDSWRRAKPAAFASLAWLLRRLEEPSSEQAVDLRFGGWPTADVVGFLLRAAGPHRLLVDKTPAYGRDPCALARAEEFSPRFLWLVRHPLGVANSWIERRRARRWEFAGAPGSACAAWLVRSSARPLRWISSRLDERAARAGLDRWRQVHAAVAGFVATVPPARVLRVDYEDLVCSPLATLARACAWLDVEFDTAMLEPWKHLPDALARGVGDELVRQHSELRADRAESWRCRLDETFLDGATRDVMRVLRLPP